MLYKYYFLALILHKTRTWTNYKEKKKELDRIEPVSRVEALIPDDVILIRSRSLDIGYGDLDDATSSEGSDV